MLERDILVLWFLIGHVMHLVLYILGIVCCIYFGFQLTLFLFVVDPFGSHLCICGIQFMKTFGDMPILLSH